MGPISELRIALMDQQSVARIQGYLEQKLQCRMTYFSQGYYLVRFPEGTIEEESPKPDPRYREETVLRFPDGATLRKCVKWPCMRPGCTHISLFLSDELEEKPKPGRGEI